jgi:hypothetical protein
MPHESPIFIVGCARSGTTLLRDLLRAHPRIFAGPETYFLPWLHAVPGSPRNESEAIALGAKILPYLHQRQFPTDLAPTDFASCRSYREAAELPFQRAAEAAGKPRWADKTPLYVEYIPEILEIFGDVKIVHIVRDGRDVARSLLRTEFGPNNLYRAAATWKRRVTHGLRAEARYGPNVVKQVRYEQLLTETESVMRGILDFVDEPFSPAVLGRCPVDPAESVELAINPAHAFKWRAKMPPKDQQIFESVAGETLAELGYEIRGVARKIPLPEKIWWWLDDRGRQAWRRLRSGPRGSQAARELWIRARMRLARRR